MSNLLKLLSPYQTISIIGMGKNVGKTTTLNYLINGFNQNNLQLALTSIGRDGENIDVVTQTEKPQIFVMANTIVITTEKLLAVCDITIEVLQVTDITTPLGRVVVVRALSAGFVQICGPSITKQLSGLIKDLQEFNADKILIDGAISRKSLASPTLAQSVVLCSGAGLSSNIRDVIDKTRHEVEMFMLPCAEEKDDDIFLTGAVSDFKMQELIFSGINLSDRQIIVDDATKIFISALTYQKLLIKRAKLRVKTPINLVCLTINPVSPRGFAFNSKEFLIQMRASISIPVYDIVLEEEHV